MSLLNEVTPAFESVLRELEFFQILHLRFSILPALEDRDNASGPVGADVMTDDRVGNVFVVSQRSSIFCPLLAMRALQSIGNLIVCVEPPRYPFAAGALVTSSLCKPRI